MRRVDYGFTIRLPAPRDRAFRWATDYQAGDLALMGFRARRRVEHLTTNTLLLTDSFDSDPFASRPGGRVVKVKLVHLWPARWSWTSTHLSGPTRRSQFLYELIPDGRGHSRLRYTGLQVERSSAQTVAQRARQLRREDVGGWRKLSAAMGRDLA
jgi:hypothetical protein